MKTFDQLIQLLSPIPSNACYDLYSMLYLTLTSISQRMNERMNQKKLACHTSVAACNCCSEDGDGVGRDPDSLSCLFCIFLGFGWGAVRGGLCKYTYITVSSLKVKLYSVEFPVCYAPVPYMEVIIA